MKYLGKIEDAKSVVTKEYVDDAISNIGGGSGGSYDDSELREELSKKADVDGVYPEMTVGMTRDMLGVGEGDEGEFLFRPTDGDGSIKDGFASIERIEGNSVVWNQMALKWVDSYTAAGVTASWDGSKIHLQGVHNSEGDVNFYSLFRSLSLMVGHKYALILQGGQYTGFYLIGGFNTQYTYKEVILEANGDVSDITLRVDEYASIGQSIDEYVTMHVTDLTRMFGADNEPSTVEEFYARLPKGIDINAYNEGEVVNMNVEGIKSVGFNAWDEEWENGTFDTNTGDNFAVSSQIRSKNLIRVAPNSTYEVVLSHSGLWIMLYDGNGNIINPSFLGNMYSLSYNAFNINVDYNPNITSFVTPSNAAYIKFYTEGLYGSTYNNDICIHLVHTGYRNGEYEPYKESEVALPILNYFPNGMRSIGDVKDELTATEAIQRIGAVDMGTLGVAVNKANEYIFTTLPTNYKAPNSLSATFPAICALFNSVSAIEADTQALTDCIYGGNNWIIVRSSKHSDLASFKAAMQGVMLYYELAEPIVTSIDKPLPLDYQVWDFGTEEAIAEGKTTPLKASIVYEFNARDTIRKNRNDIAKLNEELLQLKTTIGAGPYVLNATILDLNRAIKYYEGEQNITDLAEIRNALVNHRTIHIKYGSNFDGYFVVSGYIDSVDMITLEFLFGLTHYSIDINPTTQIGNVSQYDIVQ